MKTKILSTLTAATICACACIGASPVPARIDREDDVVTIGVASSLDNMNILTDTEALYEYGWVYNMVYDRLFSVGDDGRFIPELAVECELIFSDADVSIFTDERFLPNTSGYKQRKSLQQINDDEYPYPDWMYDTDFPMFTDTLDFFSIGGSGSEVYMRVTLRDEVKFTDGEPITSQTIIDYVDMCHNQQANTVVHKIWSIVSEVIEVEERIFEMHFNVADETHAFIDFLYEIASPYGGIVSPYNEGQNIGSGAFWIDEYEYDVTLRRNEDWWGEPVDTPTVIFKYVAEKEAFTAGEVDIWQIGDNYDLEYFESGYPDASVTKVATNPLVCLYNANSEYLSDVRMRKALSVAIGYDFASDFLRDYLLPMSNGYWAVTQVKKSSSMAKYYIYESGWGGSDIDLDLIISQKDGREVLDLAVYIQQALSWVGIQLTVRQMTASDYNEAVRSGNYDIALSYVDLNDPDSAYKAFYPTPSEDLNDVLGYTILSANTRTFISMQYYDQKLAYEDALFMNFGWKAQAFVQQDYISGVNYLENAGYILYRPIYSLSDANLVDFRWVTKRA